MRPERNEDLSAELLALLGKEAFLALVEAFAGQRKFIAVDGDHASLVAAIGEEATAKLVRIHGGNKLNVPLARDLRARQYRASGMGDVEIARRLGMTVSGVERLFLRMPDKPARPRRGPDPRQIDLFRDIP